MIEKNKVATVYGALLTILALCWAALASDNEITFVIVETVISVIGLVGYTRWLFASIDD